MKIISIGDIHGSPYWKEVVEKEPNADKIVFIGDYFDNYNRESAAEQIYNFKEIVNLKKENTDKIILLTGNHDMHYHRDFLAKDERYSGFQHAHKLEISQALHENLDYLQMCYKYDNFMFSHAGITKTWLYGLGLPENEIDVEFEVNKYFRDFPLAFSFEGWDPYGDDVTQSPIWVRPRSLTKDATSFRHIVGHTTVSGINTTINHKVILIDALRSAKEYLIIDEGELSTGKI